MTDETHQLFNVPQHNDELRVRFVRKGHGNERYMIVAKVFNTYDRNTPCTVQFSYYKERKDADNRTFWDPINDKAWQNHLLGMVFMNLIDDDGES